MFRLETDGPKAVVTLSRPPVNAINNAWITGFEALLDRLDDDEIAVLHIRSDQQVFCAGADLRQVEERFGQEDGHLRFPEEVAAFQRLFRRIETLPFVTVAEIGGTACASPRRRLGSACRKSPSASCRAPAARNVSPGFAAGASLPA